MKQLNAGTANFYAELDAMLAWESVADDKVQATVKEILNAVRSRGDAAVLEYTNRFDRMQVENFSELELTQARLNQALKNIPAEQRAALETAAQRLRSYHRHQKMQSWSYTEEDGTLLGQQVTALDRVGLYVPGGKATYPSSVLMNAIPAHVAGVDEIIMVVPTPM